ncbi:phage major capsid protein [Prosthecobacter sp.]|uniref:phage major capsid protein n=1 Tax=Prosthecobacter sp. TaxID=1965333 RepID=UPI0037844B33
MTTPFLSISRCSLLALCLLAATPSLHAAEAEDPAMAMLKRVREQLRTITIQKQKSDADLAAAQAEKVDLEAQNAELAKKLETLIKSSAAERAAAEKAIADLKEKNDEQTAEAKRLNESLAAWKAARDKLAVAAEAKQAENARLADKVIILDRRVADYRRKNEELYKAGTEVLTRYENFGLGTALTAREPFTRLTRVKMENLVQEYQDKLMDNKIKPEDSKASKASAAAVQKPAPAPAPVPAASSKAKP